MQTPPSTWEHLHIMPFKAGKNKEDYWQSIAIPTFLNEFVICYCNEEIPASSILAITCVLNA